MTRRIAVIGGGLIGRAWTLVFARAGCEVRLWDLDPEVRARALDELAETCRLSGDDPSAIAQVRVCDDMAAAVDGVEWVQENGPENLQIKREIYAELDRLAAPDTILASSSSALVASLFAEGLAGRSRILVAHPVNPPHLIPVVELCPGPDTAPEVMDRAEALMHAVAQVPVRLTREIDGFVLNRLQAVVLAESLRLIEEGVVTPEGLDHTICHGLGRRWALLGPMAAINLNAPGGVKDYLARYAPTMARLSDDAARGEAFTERVADILAAAMPPPSQVPELSRQRDERLAALRRFLRDND
ncbi:3-hydroxyacyl-CoA dehydrogenase [Alcaligenes endophyticus]|uniref:L-gulonate 3-dehydrogenase n=1 Tax=Alcaligenes endophyticus TaxID=1929088 RepID=A0ABT8EFE5_9BURK|nr:3-hydroxyacyl-CoA dehydrogenase [Alcaligenes endophyticus]MCX5590312.1 3-hydroxyacyl-CoA dehydrogenase [Alcaligenes endophyticus]MDN4120024.1 3-hydroxyacyl-CoA dehydrogenase [Alcaligenes endophyticus]